MKCELQDLRAGKISFDQFALGTADEWDRLATSMWNSWRKNIPPTVSTEDIRQEMLLHAWQAVGKWDPERGTPLEKYVVFNACAKAARFIHTQRAAKRRSDKSESRHPMAFSTIRETDEWVEAVLADSPQDPGELLDARHSFERKAREATGMDKAALRAVELSGGNLLEAAGLLFDAFPLKWKVANRWTEDTSMRTIERALSNCQ